MIYRLLRLIIALLFMIMGIALMEQAVPALSSWIDETFFYVRVFGFSLTKILLYVVGGLIGVSLGYLVGPFLISQGLNISRASIQVLSVFSTQDLLAGTIGLVFGLIIANLIGSAFLPVPIVGPFIPIVLSAIMGYVGMRLMMRKRGDIGQYLQNFRQNTKKDIAVPKEEKIFKESGKLLDTSVIIDGRISDICETGFLEGPLIVPLFVLEELQHISDSSDTLKRNKGRRGLDILNEMQQKQCSEVRVITDDYDDISEVDSKLMRLALEKNWKLITNDFNLNKVALLQGIKVLNLNDLANALKPLLATGEVITVPVLKAGKEEGQGISYLEDGTMIVIQDGEKYLNETISVVVTSVLQTSAGRMIFARPGGEQDD